MKKFLLTLFTAIFVSNSAWAFWDVQNSGEDVFGNVNVTVSSVGDNGTLIRFECGSSGEPFFAVLLRDSSGSIPDIPAEFIYVDENGSRQRSEAVLGSWNERYVAAKVTDLETLRGLAQSMVVASRPISVGVSIPFADIRVADTFSSRGSTRAGRAVLEHCIRN